MPAAEIEALRPTPLTDGCWNQVPELIRDFAEARVFRYAQSPQNFLFDPRENIEMTTRAITQMKDSYSHGSDINRFFSDVFMPVIVNPADISPTLGVKAKKLVDHWVFGDKDDLKQAKLSSLFDNFASFPKSHPSFTHEWAECRDTDRRNGIMANKLFSYALTPSQLMSGIYAQNRDDLKQNDFLKLAASVSALARCLDRIPITDPDKPVNLEMDPTDIAFTINRLRKSGTEFAFPWSQAFNTRLAEIGFRTTYDKPAFYDLHTELFIDAFHSRTEAIRNFSVEMLASLLRSHERFDDESLLAETVSNTPLDSEAAYFWRSIEDLIETQSFDDDEVLRAIAGKLDHEDNTTDPSSVGNACGALDALVEVKRILDGSNNSTKSIISPEQAANIARTILRVFRDKTTIIEDDPYGYESRARLRSLAAHLLHLDGDYANIVNDIGYQNLPHLIIRATTNTRPAEQSWVETHYPRGVDALNILQSLIPPA